MRYKEGTTERIIYPTGTWRGIYNSEELKNTLKFGYTFKVFRGYLFDKKEIFNNYVEDLFTIRSKHAKGEPMNLITKLLMNSLFGRFGMSKTRISFDVLHIKDEKIYEYFNEDKYSIEDMKFFGDKILISYIDYEKLDNNYLYSGSLKATRANTAHNISIPIAATVTAYARIHMSQFKNNPNFILLYTDTDSIYIIGDLPREFIGKNLGQFKLEHEFIDWVSLAPKVYSGITKEGQHVLIIKGLNKTSAIINTSTVEHGGPRLITHEDFKNLLIKDSTLEIKHNLWFKNVEQSKISILEQVYNLKVTDNKRKLVYAKQAAGTLGDKDNILIGTKPYKIYNDKIIHEE